jgi:hypothetical protein
MTTGTQDVPPPGMVETGTVVPDDSATAGDPSPTEQTPPRRSLTKLLLAIIGVLLLALGGMTALWVNTNSQLSAIVAERAGVPNLRGVADEHFANITSVYGDADSVSITITDSNVSKAAPALSGMPTDLGFSSAVLDRMGNTRALDGTREAQGHNCNVTWTYHPDDGLQMVFEATPPS